MNTVTIYVDKDPMVADFTVTLTPSTGGPAVICPRTVFKKYPGGDPTHAGDWVTVVPDFPARPPLPAPPKFTAELAIAGGGGAEAKAMFVVDDVGWKPVLHTTSVAHPDRQEIHA